MLSGRYHSIVRKIRQLQASLFSLPDGELCAQAQEIRSSLTHSARSGLAADSMKHRERLFALAAVAIRRTLGIEPYDEQLMGALAMSDGCAVQGRL